MKKSNMLVRAISFLLIFTFISSQVCAGECSLSNNKLALSLASDTDISGRGEEVQGDVAKVVKEGAIGKGRLLIDLLSGHFPPKLELSQEQYGDLSQKIRNAIRTAIFKYIENSSKLAPEDTGKARITRQRLISLNGKLSKELYPFKAGVEGEGNFLIGFPLDEFGREEKVALAIDFIDFLYLQYPSEIADLRLAQYLSHERTPEHIKLENGMLDLSEHKWNYTVTQTAIYGADEVVALRNDIRNFIKYKLGLYVPQARSVENEAISINGPPKSIDLAQLPAAFQQNLGRYGLNAESIKVVEIVDGLPRALAAVENPLQNSIRSQMIVGTTMLQALQAANYVGLAEALGMTEEDFGKLADGAAVTVGLKTLEFLAKEYDVTIIVAGNEGKTRDGSAAMPLGDLINPGAKNGIYLYIGDSIEVTSGVKSGKNGSSSMMALFPVAVPFEIDGYKTSLWTNFSHVKGVDPIITESNSLESVLKRLAASNNLSLAQLVKQYDIMTLNRHKNDEWIAQAKELGFKVILKKDGDPVPAILRAIYGIPDVNGKRLIVLSTGGGNEHRMAQLIATLYGKSAMATTYVSTQALKAEDKKEAGSLRPARNWQAKDLAEFVATNKIVTERNQGLGLTIPLLPQTPEELSGLIETEETLANQLRGNAAVGISVITGAPAVDAGALKSYLSPVTYYTLKDGKEKVSVTGFFVNEEGRLYFYEALLRSDNMENTRATMIGQNNYGLTPEIQTILNQASPVISTEEGRDYPIIQGTAAKNVGATNTKAIAENIVPFKGQPVIMLERTEALKKVVEARELEAKDVTQESEELKVEISKDLFYRAEMLKENLLEIFAEHPNQPFFIGIQTDIGESQEKQIMPLRTAIDHIENMVDSKGKRLFPNLIVARAKAADLVRKVRDLSEDKNVKLNLNNVFIGARASSVADGAYDLIKGEGQAWISAIDDTSAGDYIPVFEAITLNMMAYLNADIPAIKNFYDAISDKPIDPGVLQDMIRNRIIYILPRATKFDTKQLRELYELAQQVYVAA